MPKNDDLKPQYQAEDQ
jgi:hypothetical protein